MKLFEALKKHELRIEHGRKWLVFDQTEKCFVIRDWPYRSKKARVIYRSPKDDQKSFESALDVLLKEEE